MEGVETSELSLAELLAQTANEAIHSQVPEGFHWVEEYGMYYSPETGFYYNQNSSLFYNTQNETYYFFDDESQSYQVHKNMQKKVWTSQEYRKKVITLYGEEWIDKIDQDMVSVCEIVICMVDEVAFDEEGQGRMRKIQMKKKKDEEKEREVKGKRRHDSDRTVYDRDRIQKKTMERYMELDKREHTENEKEDDSADNESEYSEEEEMEEVDERVQMMEEEGFSEAPLLRIMDNCGQLFVVTISGGTIGSEKDCDIQNDGLSKVHCHIKYSEEDANYKLRVMSEKRKVKVDGQLVKMCTEAPLLHASTISVGDLSLIVHVHFGYNQCPGCDPSQKPSTSTTTSLQTTTPLLTGTAARRAMLKKLKGNYGINDHIPEKVQQSNYDDRAKKRRKIVGSEREEEKGRREGNKGEGMYANCVAKPTPGVVLPKKVDSNTAIDSGNKGFKLLKSLGWKEGEGLGREAQGRAEPVIATLKTTRSGLGSEKEKTAVAVSRREMEAQRMKERYEQVSMKEESTGMRNSSK